jgi:sec-independent protein translocase protein TatA
MHYFADILGVGAPELLIILVIVLLLFGSTKLPALLRSLGSSMRELRKGMNGEGESDEKAAQTKKP